MDKPICSRCGCFVSRPFTANILDENGDERKVRNKIVDKSTIRSVIVYRHDHCVWRPDKQDESRDKLASFHAMRGDVKKQEKQVDFQLPGYRIRKKGSHIMFILPNQIFKSWQVDKK